jgi:tetratricopeptide (TPR) repeat protein
MGAALILLFLQAVDFNAEGRKALEAEDYQAAVRHFSRAVADDPQEYTARFHLALAQSMLKRDAEAVAEYRKVLELKPGLYQAELNLGILLLRQNNAAEAAAVLGRAAESKPGEYRPRYYLAEAWAASGEQAKAAAAYRAALEINPKSAEAELGLARAESRQGRLAEAAPHFRKAAELDAGFQDALFELAGLYEKAGQPAEAIAIYKQFPGNVAAQERLGTLLLENKQYGEAIPRLEQAYRQDPTQANRLALAAGYAFNKEPAKAIPLLEQAVKAAPDDFDIRNMYGRALRDARNFAPAAEQFHAAVKLKPDARQAWNDLAATLYLAGAYPQAVAALDRALQLGEDTPANHYFRAITLDRLNDEKGALAAYRKFLSMSGGKNPDEEFKARQRARILEKELSRK